MSSSILDKATKAFGARVIVPESAAAPGAVQPVDVATAAELVRWAGQLGCKILPIGSGSKLHWHCGVAVPAAHAGGTTAPQPPPAQVGPGGRDLPGGGRDARAPTGEVLYLDMRRCARVLEHEPEDMTVTVDAGMTLAALGATLAKHKQRVTLDPPYADRATVGGVLGANDSGPVRFAYGTARDAVIGMSMIQADGTTIKSGGKVVKNVAGYDLHKLFIGSFGSLGVIGTVTFRLRPLPEARTAVMLEPVDEADAERMIADVLAGPTRPTFIELLNARMARALDIDSRLTLMIGFEENAEAAAWQADRITESLGGDRLTDRYALQVYERLREAAGLAAQTSFRATMLSSNVACFVERLNRHPVRIIARAGNGIVYGLLDESLAESVWGEIQAAINADGGCLQMRGAPASIHLSARGDFHLSTGIRRAFDPEARFTPG